MQKIVELCVQAGHPEPESIEQAGALGVRFLPSAYIALQCKSLAARQDVTLGELHSSAGPTVAVRTFRDDLLHLKLSGIIGLRGRGRGVMWFIVRDTQR